MISSCHLEYELQANRIPFQTYKLRTKTEIGLAKCLNSRLKDDRLFEVYQLFLVLTTVSSLPTTLLIFNTF